MFVGPDLGDRMYLTIRGLDGVARPVLERREPGGAWVAGIGRRHADPEITPNHDVCNYCHEYDEGSSSPYNLGTMHRDGSIQLNAAVGTDLGYQEQGTAPNMTIGTRLDAFAPT